MYAYTSFPYYEQKFLNGCGSSHNRTLNFLNDIFSTVVGARHADLPCPRLPPLKYMKWLLCDTSVRYLQTQANRVTGITNMRSVSDIVHVCVRCGAVRVCVRCNEGTTDLSSPSKFSRYPSVFHFFTTSSHTSGKYYYNITYWKY